MGSRRAGKNLDDMLLLEAARARHIPIPEIRTGDLVGIALAFLGIHPGLLDDEELDAARREAGMHAAIDHVMEIAEMNGSLLFVLLGSAKEEAKDP
jgi:hypothetical protein